MWPSSKKERFNISVSKVTCGLLFCLTTGVFAAGENVELLTSDRIENAVPDQVGKTVTIMVQDEMGPVAGANVVVKGTTNGNISDMDGKVVLQNVPNNSTLVISFIGYTTQEVKVSNQATIHVKLVEDAKSIGRSCGDRLWFFGQEAGDQRHHLVEGR